LVSQPIRKATTIITIAATILALFVIILGSYTRLKDAGLGCPDWPGCYGFIIPPLTEQAINQANSAFPERPLEHDKAWPEMIHRYLASGLGFVILIILSLSLINRKHPAQPVKLPVALTVLVIFQGILGMWTVTMSLFPPVVMSHLMGGFTTFSLLFLLCLRLSQVMPPIKEPLISRLFPYTVLGMVLLLIQIALGGWVAANYAAVVCTELPICQGNWTQHLAIKEAFTFWGHDAADYEFAPHLGPDAKITIHVAHRIGAIVVSLYLLAIGLKLFYASNIRRYRNLSLIMLFTLAVQIALGVSNVVFELPLFVAVAHNAVGALLLLQMLAINYSVYKSRPTQDLSQ